MSGHRITIDMRGAVRTAVRLQSLSATGIARVKQRAIATLGRRVGTQAARLIGADLNLGATKIKNRIHTVVSGDYVDLVASKNAIPVSRTDFAARWAGRRSTGGSYQIWKDEPRRMHNSSWISSRTGNLLTRARKGGTGARYSRLPVRRITGPAIGSLLISSGNRQIAGPLLTFARDILAAEIARLINVEFKS